MTECLWTRVLKHVCAAAAAQRVSGWPKHGICTADAGGLASSSRHRLSPTMAAVIPHARPQTQYSTLDLQLAGPEAGQAAWYAAMYARACAMCFRIASSTRSVAPLALRGTAGLAARGKVRAVSQRADLGDRILRSAPVRLCLHALDRCPAILRTAFRSAQAKDSFVLTS